jgi:lysozyme family protein
MNFDQAFDILIGPEFEGDYSDHPSDPGGKTRYGITERVARRHGYQGSMRELPKSLAASIAKSEYWDVIRNDELPDEIRYPMFDAAYNSGPAQAAMWLQRAVGSAADGVIGPNTLKAVHQADPYHLRARLLATRMRFLTGLGTWHDFGRGWMRRIAAILEQ